MKRNDVLRVDQRREGEHLSQRAMAPTDMVGVLVRRVLAVMDQQIALFGKRSS